RTGTTSSPPCARSTGCCCGTTTRCRNISSRRFATPTGTSSASPRNSRATAASTSCRGGCCPSARRRSSAASRRAGNERIATFPSRFARHGRIHAMRPGGFLTRRGFVALAGAALAAPFLPEDALAALATETPLHGISPFGELKYGPDFTHFDYANPDAPKGGTFNFSVPNWQFNQSVLTFNTLNSFVARGDAPPRMELCFDSLFSGALDEPDSSYGLVAETVTISADRNSFTFRLRPQARFHDGSPITAQDAAFTFNILKEDGHPSLMLPLAEMVEAVAVDERTLRVAFSGRQSPRTIFSVAGYPVLSKAYFSGNPFDASQLKAPLGSGAYRVGRVVAGQSIEYERVAD